MDWNILLVVLQAGVGAYLTYMGFRFENPGQKYLCISMGFFLVALTAVKTYIDNQGQQATQAQLKDIQESQKSISSILLRTQPETFKQQLSASTEYAYCVNGPYVLLVALISITNTGGIKSAVDDFLVQLSDSKIVKPMALGVPNSKINVMLGLGPNLYDLSLLTDQFIQHRTINGLNAGERVHGWIVAEINQCSVLEGAQISFRDTLQHRYSLHIDSFQVVPPLPSFDSQPNAPDIAPMFREREWLKQHK